MGGRDERRIGSVVVMKGLTITWDDGGEPLVEEFAGGLAELQKAVGGFIEAIPTGEDVTMWINEEGKYTDTRVNRLAMDVWIRWDIHRCMIDGHDWIAGPCVVTGGVDEHGETLDISDGARRWVLRVARDAGAALP